IESLDGTSVSNPADTPDYLMNDILEQPSESFQNDPSKKKRELLVATTRIIASRYDLGAKFECRVAWNNSVDYEETAHWSAHHGRTRAGGSSKLNDASLLHEWLLLDIKVRPLSIRVESPLTPVV